MPPFNPDKHDDALAQESIIDAREAVIEVLRRFRKAPGGVSFLPKGLPKHVTQAAARAAIDAWIRRRVEQARGRTTPGVVEAMIYGLDFDDAPVECPVCLRLLDAATAESVL